MVENGEWTAGPGHLITYIFPSIYYVANIIDSQFRSIF